MDRAERLFDEMKRREKSGELSRNIISYNSMLNCYAESRNHEKVAKAENIFKWMKSESTKDGKLNLKPTLLTYGTMLKAYVKLKEPQRAQEILQEMYDIYRTGDTTLKPQAFHFDQIMNCWLESKHEWKNEMTAKMLDMKRQLYARNYSKSDSETSEKKLDP